MIMTANSTAIMLNVYISSDMTSQIRFTEMVGDYDGKHHCYHVTSRPHPISENNNQNYIRFIIQHNLPDFCFQRKMWRDIWAMYCFSVMLLQLHIQNCVIL